MKTLFLLFVLVSVSNTAWGACAQGYSSLERAVSAAAAIYSSEDLDWCASAPAEKETNSYADYPLKKACTHIREIDGEDQIVTSEILFMRLNADSGGACNMSGKDFYIIFYNGSLFEYFGKQEDFHPDVNPNI